MYFDAEFNADSDFAIKRGPNPSFSWFTGVPQEPRTKVNTYLSDTYKYHGISASPITYFALSLVRH